MCTHSIRALFAAGPGGHDWLSDICISNDFWAEQRSQRRNMRTAGGKLNSCQKQWIRSPDGKAPEWVCKTTAQSSHVEPGHNVSQPSTARTQRLTAQYSQDTSHRPAQPGHRLTAQYSRDTTSHSQNSQDATSHSPVQPGHGVSQSSTARTRLTAQYSPDTSHSPVRPGYNVSQSVQPGKSVSQPVQQGQSVSQPMQQEQSVSPPSTARAQINSAVQPGHSVP